jgi:hypothetical protein
VEYVKKPGKNSRLNTQVGNTQWINVDSYLGSSKTIFVIKNRRVH